jgi:hypothetical protein
MDSSGVLWSPTRNPFWGPKVAGGSTTTVHSRVSLTKVCEFPKERLGLFLRRSGVGATKGTTPPYRAGLRAIRVGHIL